MYTYVFESAHWGRNNKPLTLFLIKTIFLLILSHGLWCMLSHFRMILLIVAKLLNYFILKPQFFWFIYIEVQTFCAICVCKTRISFTWYNKHHFLLKKKWMSDFSPFYSHSQALSLAFHICLKHVKLFFFHSWIYQRLKSPLTARLASWHNMVPNNLSLWICSPFSFSW